MKQPLILTISMYILHEQVIINLKIPPFLMIIIVKQIVLFVINKYKCLVENTESCKLFCFNFN